MPRKVIKGMRIRHRRVRATGGAKIGKIHSLNLFSITLDPAFYRKCSWSEFPKFILHFKYVSNDQNRTLLQMQYSCPVFIKICREESYRRQKFKKKYTNDCENVNYKIELLKIFTLKLLKFVIKNWCNLYIVYFYTQSKIWFILNRDRQPHLASAAEYKINIAATDRTSIFYKTLL